jgi:hypothetical protein
MHKSDIRLEPVDSRFEAERRRTRGRLLDLEKKRLRQNQSLARQLRALKSEYRRNLSALMGPGGLRRYRYLRKKRSKAPRSQRIRESNALLDEIGIDRLRTARLRKNYLDAARKLLAVDDARLPTRRPPLLDTRTSPWVTYTAPYGGYVWSFQWERSDEASDPVLARHLDRTTGQIGSAIQTRLSGADDDDRLYAEYYTALNVWHIALATGPLEGYFAFAFRTSTYSGQVSDEFGLSHATYIQHAFADFQVLDSQGWLDTQWSHMFTVADSASGEDAYWNGYVAAPNDVHWYYFKTPASFAQRSALVLQAGIGNMTWFLSDDESITTADDLDLRLDRIMVRSCPS